MSVIQSPRGDTKTHTAHPSHPAIPTETIPPSWGVRRRRWLLPVIIVAASVLLLLGAKMLLDDSAQPSDDLVFFTVKRGTLPITVTERGNLESQQTEEIICEVENFGGDRSGVTGTQILFIVANGSSVKKGDLLVELDSAPLKERLDSQFLSLQRAEAEKIQANSKYENQITQNETDLADAELQMRLTELDKDSYEDETGGTFQIELQNLEMEIQTARAQQMIRKSDRDAFEQLYQLGYKSKGDLAAAKLELLKADSNLASQMARAKQLQKYTYEMEKLSRQGKFETAKRNLEQVERNNKSALAQAEAARDAADRAYEKEKERYDRYTMQLEKCKIYAPQDGMVAYAVGEGRFNRGDVIEEGAFVRERQEILTLPNLAIMQVNTAVHESVLDQVRPGLKCAIRVDAFPDRSYPGTVKSVAVLPDQGGWLASDTKVYKTLVTIDEEVSQLKPGMTAVVEIDVEKLQDVLSIPIQAIVQRGSQNWCYVRENGSVVKRAAVLGKTNDKFVQIKEGLSEGDVVVLNPSGLVDEENAAQRKQEKAAAEDAPNGEEGAGVGADDDAAAEAPTGENPPATGGKPAEAVGGKPAEASGGDAVPKGRPEGRGGPGFAGFDKDGDGQVTKAELPEQMQGMFDQLDKNQDGVITRDEIPQGRGGRPKPPADAAPRASANTATQ